MPSRSLLGCLAMEPLTVTFCSFNTQFVRSRNLDLEHRQSAAEQPALTVYEIDLN